MPPRQPSNGNAPTAKQEAAAVHAEAARVVQTIPTIIKDMKNIMAKKETAQPANAQALPTANAPAQPPEPTAPKKKKKTNAKEQGTVANNVPHISTRVGRVVKSREVLDL